jgi:glycine betaine/proline transport system ATP-binding protein
VVFISHDLAEAARIADRIAVMAEGQLRQVGTPAEIIENPADEYVRAFFRDAQPGRLFTAGDIAVAGEVVEGVEPVPATVFLEDVIPRAAESDAPVPVADAQGNIVGSIDRARLLRALAKARSV